MNSKTISAALACTLLAACSSSSDDTPTTTEDVTINFAAEANNVAIDCDTQLSVGDPTTNVSVKDFRFYVHNVAMIDDQGTRHSVTLETNTWQNQNVALLDFTNKDTSCSGNAKDTRTQVNGSVSVPEGTNIKGLEFTLGLPNALNHADRATAAAPLNITGLHWNWQNGYKFARLDVVPVGGITRPTDNEYSATSWNFHLGSTGCTGNPQQGEAVTCARSDRPVITLNTFDSQNDVVLLDYAALVSSSNLTEDKGGAPGCMSGATDPECASIFNALGMNVTTGALDSSQTQSVFSVRSSVR